MSFRNQTLRTISSLVLLCYLSLITQPLQAAVQQEVFARPKPNTDHSTPVNQLEQMRELMRQLHNQQAFDTKPNRATALLQWQTRQQQQEKVSTNGLLALKDAVLQESIAQEQQLQSTETHIKNKQLPASILQRHQAVVKQLQERRQQLQNSLQQLAKAQQQNKITERKKILDILSKQLEQWGGEKAQYTDSKHLPWGNPSSKVRAPLDSKQAYLQHLHDVLGVAPIRVAGALPSDMIWPVLPTLSEEVQATDTAANEDVQFTPAIQEKAAELNHNPAQIYKWVYDNIDYVPTYGSIQGADFTLQSKRGNAFDTSSLLIALLRASNIPARYVYGTIEVPTKQLLNWVGGVNTMDAAQNLIGQGGIPNVALTLGGKDIAVHMEHVWVEAYIDFVPSRGVVNKKPDTWVPLDAAYKQNAYTAGMDLQQAVPFDAQALITAAQQGATVNEQSGYVQNLNQQAVQSALTDYQTRLQAHLQQNPTTTVGDILGTKNIKPYPSRGLASSLPYKITAIAGDYHTLPDTMRHYFTVQIFQNSTEQQMNEPSTEVKLSTVKLAGQQFALSFKPTTTADEQTINSYLPTPHADGSPIQASELPQSMAGYLIHLSPEISLNGQVLNNPNTASFMMGEQVTTRLGYISPNNTQQPLVTKLVEAGEYHAIGIDLQGESEKLMAVSEVSINNAQSTDDISSLTKHDMTGNILQAGIRAYFAFNNKYDELAAKRSDIITLSHLSFGTFSSNLKPNMRYGFPLSIRFSGLLMDIDNLKNITVRKDNNHNELIIYNESVAYIHSAYEHIIPELLLTGKLNNDNIISISAVKALALAVNEGKKIYTINKNNYINILSTNNYPSIVSQDIINAISANKNVVISDLPVSTSNWSGYGYIISDPRTGGSAYLISGGFNGGAASTAESVEYGVSVLSDAAKTATGYAINFFGLVKCQLDGVLSAIAILAVIMALNYCAPTIIRTLKTPEIAAEAVAFITTAIVSSLTLVGVANASSVLQNNCECKSGIYNPNTNSCWVCTVVSYAPIRDRVIYAKAVVAGLGQCSIAMNSSQLLTRAYAYGELGSAREDENKCWLPSDPDHIREESEAKRISAECKGFLGVLSP